MQPSPRNPAAQALLLGWVDPEQRLTDAEVKFEASFHRHLVSKRTPTKLSPMGVPLAAVLAIPPASGRVGK